MGRTVLAIVCGLLVSFLVVMLGDGVSAAIAPLPAGVDSHDSEALRGVMDEIPMVGFLALLAGVALAGIAGPWVAAKLSRTAHMRNAMIVGFLLWVATIVNLLTVPHPVWFAIVSVLIVLPAAWFGGKLARRVNVAS